MNQPLYYRQIYSLDFRVTINFDDYIHVWQYENC